MIFEIATHILIRKKKSEVKVKFFKHHLRYNKNILKKNWKTLKLKSHLKLQWTTLPLATTMKVAFTAQENIKIRQLSRGALSRHLKKKQFSKNSTPETTKNNTCNCKESCLTHKQDVRRDNWAGKILADKLKYENSILRKVFQLHTYWKNNVRSKLEARALGFKGGGVTSRPSGKEPGSCEGGSIINQVENLFTGQKIVYGIKSSSQLQDTCSRKSNKIAQNCVK